MNARRHLLPDPRSYVLCLVKKVKVQVVFHAVDENKINVTSTPGHVLTTSLLRPKKIKDVVRTWYGLVGRGRNVVRT